MELTHESIQQDIKAYQIRIQAAADRLAALPVGKYETRKDKSARRLLTSEIDHVHRLLVYARDALRDLN